MRMSYSAHAGLALAVGPRTGSAGDWGVPDEQFAVTYDGPALRSMDVRQLAPSLLGVADAVQEAARLAQPGAPQPALQIQATRTGSFVVDLLLADPASAVDRALDLFAGRGFTAAANVGGVVGSCFGAFQVIKYVRGRRIARRTETRPGWVRVDFDDGTSLLVPGKSVTLAEGLAFRQAARAMVEPLGGQGVTRIDLTGHGLDCVRIEDEDLPAFAVPEAGEELLSDQVREVVVSLLNVAFVQGNKWRLSDGENSLYAAVHDLEFLNGVQTNQEAFAAGDLLRVRLRTQQWRSDGQVRNEHVVEQVIEHIRGPRTVPLPFVDDDPS